MKQDCSPHIPQRDKLKEKLTIKELNWTEKQKTVIEKGLSRETKAMFLGGPSGSAKTLLAVYMSLKLLSEKRVSDIIYVRSAVESSKAKIGFLPGDVEEKLHFYNLPFYDKLEELLPKAQIEILRKDNRISMYPVNYARGLSWNAKVVIFDEVQNSRIEEIITVMTRLGPFSKIFLLADPMQIDLDGVKYCAFVEVLNLFSDIQSEKMGIFSFEFNEEDIVRSEFVKFLVQKFKNLPNLNRV